MNDPLIRQASKEDAAAIAAIYNHYVEHSYATFETSLISTDEAAERIGDVVSNGYPYFACESEGAVVGYAPANRWKSRCAYASTVETSIYVDRVFVGCGIGTRLGRALIEASHASGYHALIAGIALPNPASVALHETLGFEKAAHFRETGYKLNRWIDVGYWELLLTAS
jgi:L-amino acid N-acyltransferase YncA